MAADLLKQIEAYVVENIPDFHRKRLNCLQHLKLETVLKKKNPYLFKAKSMESADSIVRALTGAFLSSNEETVFGEWLEQLAIYVSKLTSAGWKSGIPGIDLEFDREKIRYIVSIKSGPNWGNSSQIKKMKSDFLAAKRTLSTSDSKLRIGAVNGCCYGRTATPDKGDYFKYCGQDFWEFLSGLPHLYLEMVEPLGQQAKRRNKSFDEQYVKTVNLFTKEFIEKFCKQDGSIDWLKLVRFNSGS